MSFVPSVAFLTSSVGTGEWIVLFVVVLIVVGPKRLPEVARKIGRTMEMFRRAADEFRDQLMSMDQEPAQPAAPSGESGSVEHSDPYADAYSGESGYPGNEEHAANWDTSTGTAGEGQGPDVGQAGEAAASAEPEGPAGGQDKPPEGQA